MDRRRFLTGAAATAAGVAMGSRLSAHGGPVDALIDTSPPPRFDDWAAGDVRHILPGATHDRFRVKVSFRNRRATTPMLTVDGTPLAGAREDSDGQHWSFDVSGLTPETEYALALVDADGGVITDTWPLRTFPHPGSRSSTFRLAAFTCAGGPGEEFFDPRQGRPEPLFRPLATRRRLLRRMLDFSPQVALAIGDHVYWDMRSLPNALGLGMSPQAAATAGLFVRQLPIMGTPNEGTLKRAFAPQIADLYGVMFRSVPVLFSQDDHDHTENDDANDLYRTFPADEFMVEAARVTQRFFFPEFLDTSGLPGALGSTSFGVLRWGKLFEGWLYDCRGFLTNASDPATGHTSSRFLPRSVEEWLNERAGRGDTVHGVHIPSTPVLWSAGKWLEWYPDVVGDDGQLTTDEAKPYWAQGWNHQHDRLLAAHAARTDRIPLWLSGDLHASGLGRISATNGTGLPREVVSVLAGTIGTGKPGFPSAFRGSAPQVSTTIQGHEDYRAVEENGFSILDFTPQGVTMRQFMWSPDDGEDAIDTLAARHTTVIGR